MFIQSIRDEISAINPNALMFDNPSFDASIVGLTDDDRVVYNFDKMIVELAEDDNIDVIEAQEFIEYNTVRSLPYAGECAPIIIYPLLDCEN